MYRKRKLVRYVFNLSFLIFLALACTSAPTSTPKEVQSNQKETIDTTSSPVETGLDTPSGGITPGADQTSPTPKPTVAPSDDPWMISLDNYNQITLLERLGGMPLGGISSVTWSPDGKWLLIMGTVGTALYDADTLTLQWAGRLGRLISFSKDSDIFYFMSTFSEEIEVRQVPDGALERVIALEKIPMTFVTTDMDGKVIDEVTRTGLNAGALLISPDAKRMAGINDSKRLILVWDLDSGKNIAQVDYEKQLETEYDEVSETAFSADGLNLYLGMITGAVMQVNLETGQVTSIYKGEYKLTAEGGPRERHCDMYSQNGLTMAAFCARYTADPQTDQIISITYILKLVNTTGAQPLQESFATKDLYMMMGFIPGEKQAILYSKENYDIWDYSSGKITKTAAPFCNGSYSFFAPKVANLVASIGKAGVEGKLDICDLSSGDVMVSLKQYYVPLTSTAIGRSTEGYLIAAGNCDGEINLWDSRTSRNINSLNAHEGCITSMAFSADGRYLVSGGEDKKVALWDTTSPGKEPLVTYNHPEEIIDVSISYDGETVASISKFQLQVWSTSTNENIQTKTVNEAEAVTLGPGGWLSYMDKDIIYWDDQYNPDAMYLPDMGRLVTNPSMNTLVFNDKLNKEVLFIDTKNESVLHKVEIKSYMPYLENIAFTPDGCMLVGVNEALGFDFWKSSSFEALEDTAYYRIPEDDYDHRIINAAISHDGHLVTLANMDGSLLIWGLLGVLAEPVGSGVPLITCEEVILPTPTPEPTATTIPPTATPVALTRNLFLNDPQMVGDDVLALQKRLKELGYNEVGNPDGVFGKKTDEAVRNYQEDNGLVVDGVIGPITWEKLFGSTE